MTHANEVHPAFSIVYDHTYGTNSGKYFVANGALVSGQTLWQSTSPISVEAGVAYRFEAYLMSLTADTNGFPRVRFQIGDGTTWADLGTTNVAWVTGEKNIWHSIYADGQVQYCRYLLYQAAQ